MGRARNELEEQAVEATEPAPAEGPAPEPVAEEEPAAAPEPEPAREAPAAAKKAAAKKPKAEKPKAEKKAKAKPRTTAKRPVERKALVRMPRPERHRGTVKERRGTVVSSAMDKTIVIRVDTTRPDRTYKKVVRRSQKFHAHDERNEANVGDVVRIVETRPLSKTKSWRLAEILETAK
jgi:small subunit ribosomal protein S17